MENYFLLVPYIYVGNGRDSDVMVRSLNYKNSIYPMKTLMF